MYVSLNWLSDFVSIPKKDAGKTLQKLLTLHTAEVEAVIDQAERYNNVVIGQIKEVSKHPNASRLNLTKTDIGGEIVQIVCGGQNLSEGMLVAVALPGAVVDVHGQGLFEIKDAEIRGEKSKGMICAGEEIWLEPDNTPESTEVHIKDLSWTKAKPGTPLAEVLGQADTILEIDNKSLTHRPDLWSHYGIARELAALQKTELKAIDKFVPTAPKASKEAPFKIELKDAKACDRFSSMVISDFKVGPSPEWLKNRLEACGQHSINNIVDITNYVMLELGQPMHAYDAELVGTAGLRVRTAKKGEKLVALDENEYELNEGDILVCNLNDEPVGIAGIKGGLKSGINASTSTLILEAAHFDSIMVRKSSTQHQLRTDASQRFEKNIDPALTELAIRRAAALVMELCPSAKVISSLETVGAWQPETVKLFISPDTVRSKIGAPIPDQEMQEILERLGFELENSKAEWAVTVPSWRATGDVDIPEDLVEEIARVHGYNDVVGILPELPIQAPEPNVERRAEYAARHILADNMGFTELCNYSFYGRDRLAACRISEDNHIRILNPLSEDQTHMRSTMTPNVLAALAKNARNRSVMRSFELGRTYKPSQDVMPLETKMLNVAMAELDPARDIFYGIKGALEHFMTQFNVKGLRLQAMEKPLPYAHPKECFEILIGNESVGFLFKAHPAVLKNFDIPHQVGIFAVNFPKTVARRNLKMGVTEPARFPGMAMDVSFLVPVRTEIGKIEKAIRSADKNKLIEKVELFDIYKGQGIPEGQHSLSFSIELRHPDRTLTEQEFAELQKGVFLALEGIGATIRGK